MGPTIKDIAKLAGVNHGVVSHVLRDDAYAATLRPETRARIKKIAGEIGYIHNSLAAATRTGIVKTIAVIFPCGRSGLPFTSTRDIDGIMSRATALGYGVKIFSDEKLEQTFKEIQCGKIKHVISGQSMDTLAVTAELCRQADIRLLFINQPFPECKSIVIDNAGGMAMAVRYLAERGHRRIAYLCSGTDAYSSVERLAGYKRGMKELGLDCRWLIEASTEFVGAGATLFTRPEGKRPTAAVCETNGRAAAAQITAVKMGLRIPEDISTIGFGNNETAFWEATYSPLCTINEFPFEIGKAAVDIVFGNDSPCLTKVNPNLYLLKPELVIRDSIKPCNEERDMHSRISKINRCSINKTKKGDRKK